MSQEINHPEYNTPENNPTPDNNSQKNYNWIFAVVILLLIISNIYFVVQLNKAKEERDIVQTDLDNSESTREALETDYNAALVRLDELVTKNATMDSIVNDRDSEVALLKREINKIIKDKNATEAELSKARRLIGILNNKARVYEERIAMLESDNERLGQENVLLAEERNKLSEEREELYKLGSVLHASNIRMMPIDIRRGGKKIKETERARRVDVMRVIFDIDENRITETSVKEIFLRITAPNGTVLSNAAYGSGVTTLDNGETLNYTTSKLIELQKNKSVGNITVDWNQDSEYVEGTYKIEIFQGGFKIGNGNVTLK